MLAPNGLSGPRPRAVSPLRRQHNVTSGTIPSKGSRPSDSPLRPILPKSSHDPEDATTWSHFPHCGPRAGTARLFPGSSAEHGARSTYQRIGRVAFVIAVELRSAEM